MRATLVAYPVARYIADAQHAKLPRLVRYTGHVSLTRVGVRAMLLARRLVFGVALLRVPFTVRISLTHVGTRAVLLARRCLPGTYSFVASTQRRSMYVQPVCEWFFTMT